MLLPRFLVASELVSWLYHDFVWCLVSIHSAARNDSGLSLRLLLLIKYLRVLQVVFAEGMNTLSCLCGLLVHCRYAYPSLRMHFYVALTIIYELIVLKLFVEQVLLWLWLRISLFRNSYGSVGIYDNDILLTFLFHMVITDRVLFLNWFALGHKTAWWEVVRLVLEALLVEVSSWDAR